MPVAPAARRLKVAVTGAGLNLSPDGREGWAVRAHLPALKALPELFEVVAVCTTRLETARASAAHFGVPHAYASVEDMLREQPEIDIVCVSARPVHHYAIARAALRAGKHVYCEQPLGVSTAQAEELTALARQHGLRTVVGHQSHYEPATLLMAELVRQGYIGRPLTFQHSYFVANYIAPRPSHRQWLFEAGMGGHPGYRSGHSLDRVHQVLGQDVTSICADMAVKVPERRALDRDGVIRSDQVENMNYLLRVGAEVMGTLQVSFTAWFGTGNRLEVYGTEGMLMLATGDSPAWRKEAGQGDPTRGELKLFGARVDMEQLMSEPTAPERLQKQFREIPVPPDYHWVPGIERSRAAFLVAQTWHAFARAIHEGRECAPSFRDKLKIHRIWDAAEESVRTRAWQNVDYRGIP
jgi:predicted dehydrogenase